MRRPCLQTLGGEMLPGVGHLWVSMLGSLRISIVRSITSQQQYALGEKSGLLVGIEENPESDRNKAQAADQSDGMGREILRNGTTRQN